MGWETSRRRKDPPGWSKLREFTINRALGLCEAMEIDRLSDNPEPQRCTYQGTDVDHIVNVARGGTDHPDNLQLLCSWHHKQKTAREASANRPRVTEKHKREAHPGLQ